MAVITLDDDLTLEQLLEYQEAITTRMKGMKNEKPAPVETPADKDIKKGYENWDMKLPTSVADAYNEAIAQSESSKEQARLNMIRNIATGDTSSVHDDAVKISGIDKISLKAADKISHDLVNKVRRVGYDYYRGEELIGEVRNSDCECVAHYCGEWNDELLMSIAAKAPLSIRFFPYLTDQICCLAVEKDPSAVEYVPVECRNAWNRALEKRGELIKYYRGNIPEEVALIAVHQNGNAIRYIPHKLRTDNVICTALEQDPTCLKYLKKGNDACYKAYISSNNENRKKVMEYIPDEMIIDFITEQVEAEMSDDKPSETDK